MNRKPSSIGIYLNPKDARAALEEVVRVLNPPVPRSRRKPKGLAKPIDLKLDEREMAVRELVLKWKKSGPDLRKLFAKEPTLEAEARDLRFVLWPSEDGGGNLELAAMFWDVDLPPQKRAIRDFFLLILNPAWRLLGGPCKQCNRFYIKKNERHLVFCSRSCSSRHTAVKSVQAAREQQRHEKARVVQAAISRWKPTRYRKDWKQWVSRETLVSQHWITRAIKRGDICAPRE